MIEQLFERQVETAQRRLEALVRAVVESPRVSKELVAETLEELAISLYELEAAQEELRQQNEELIASRQAIEAERQRYQELFDFAPGGYLVTNGEGIIQEANRAAAVLLGVRQDLLVGKPLAVFVPIEDRFSFRAWLAQPHAEGTVKQWELRLQPREGAPLYAAITVAARRDPIHQMVSLRWLLRDITERVLMEETLRETVRRLEQTLATLKATQQQVLQQERLAAVGQLAAGIAHDFNNILTSIIGFAELLQNDPHMPRAAQEEDLARIVQQGRQAAHLVRQILDFSRISSRQPRPLNLTHFLREVVKFMERTIPENISIRLESDSEEYLISADPAQLQQMFTNLAVNARDAMPGGGELRFKLTHLGLEPDQSLSYPETWQKEWVVCSVSDNGAGIPAEALPYVFEPFFTTKELGRGTGLGLAQVYGIVTQHQGCIEVTSQVGKGTTFTIYLPLLAAGQKTSPEETPAPQKFGRGETVLLVEDEPNVLAVGRAILKDLGYNVLIASNGQEALTVYAKHRDEIALVLTDMVMPHMDGLALFQALQAQNPEVKIALMTGYPLEAEKQQLLTRAKVVWLPKPLTYVGLAQLVSRLLK